MEEFVVLASCNTLLINAETKKKVYTLTVNVSRKAAKHVRGQNEHSKHTHTKRSRYWLGKRRQQTKKVTKGLTKFLLNVDCFFVSTLVKKLFFFSIPFLSSTITDQRFPTASFCKQNTQSCL